MFGRAGGCCLGLDSMGEAACRTVVGSYPPFEWPGTVRLRDSSGAWQAIPDRCDSVENQQKAIIKMERISSVLAMSLCGQMAFKSTSSSSLAFASLASKGVKTIKTKLIKEPESEVKSESPCKC